MTLLMVDLDNTLVDRTGAYRRWAEAFAASRGGEAADLAWLIQLDADGQAPREEVAIQVIDRFGLRDTTVPQLVAAIWRTIIANIGVLPDVRTALASARSAGFRIVCVTNGSHAQQQRKIDVTGLAERLDGVVVSETAGVSKPDPGIFRIAAELADRPLRDAWMVGDSADADIAGAASVGANTAWLSRGRTWPLPNPSPTIEARTFSAAISGILAAQRAAS